MRGCLSNLNEIGFGGNGKMRVLDTFDANVFEPYRELGMDVGLTTRLAVAGKSIAPSLVK